jgi:hypothetical protein
VLFLRLIHPLDGCFFQVNSPTLFQVNSPTPERGFSNQFTRRVKFIKEGMASTIRKAYCF